MGEQGGPWKSLSQGQRGAEVACVGYTFSVNEDTYTCQFGLGGGVGGPEGAGSVSEKTRRIRLIGT